MLEQIWAAVWAENTTPGRAVVAVIALLLLRALLVSSRELSRYRHEAQQLVRVEVRLKAERDARATAPAPAEATPAPAPDGVADDGPSHRGPAMVDLDVLREGGDPSSLIQERLSAIAKLRSHRVKVNVNTLQQLTLAREEARPGTGAARFTASMAIMLGLLGTFVGLATMIQGIQLALPQDLGEGSGDSWMQSMRNVFGVLAGIKTAFSASLVGMTCAVVLTFLAARLERAQAALLERLERFTVEDLLPMTVPVVEDESLLEEVSLRLETSFDLLQDIYEQNQSALKELTAAQEAFVAIVGEVRQITRSEASRNLDRVVEQLDQSNRAVLAVAESLPKLGGAIENANRRFLHRMGELLPAATASSWSAPGGKRSLPWPVG